MRQVLVSLVLLTAPMISQAQGVISTIAGNGTLASSGDGGPATSASLQPIGLAVDKGGNVYIADLATSVIRKVNAAGVISTVAGHVGRPMDGGGECGGADGWGRRKRWRTGHPSGHLSQLRTQRTCS